MKTPVTSTLTGNRHHYQCVMNATLRYPYVESGTWFIAFRRDFLFPSSVQKSKTRFIRPRPTPTSNDRLTVSSRLHSPGRPAIPPRAVTSSSVHQRARFCCRGHTTHAICFTWLPTEMVVRSAVRNQTCAKCHTDLSRTMVT
jgi:hypothetical protein